MFLLLAGLAALGGLLASQDSEGMFLYVTVPQKIRSNESEDWEKQVTYIITIDNKPYTLHLRKHSFVSQNFLVYTYNETGSLHSESSYFKMHCHYQGYIAGFPNSVVTLSICSGLRGFLQFENISYGIEPLESSARFQHIIYQVKNDHTDKPMLAENYSNIWQKDQSYTIHLSSQEKTFSELLPQYLEMHIIVEKALYDYMGSEMVAVTQKIIQIIGLVNAMFSQFKLTVILSSLELWSDKNRISTIGEADDLLQRFLAWKQDYLILRPHDVTFLLIVSSGVRIFSNCSMHEYRSFVSTFEAQCLQKFSILKPFYQNQSVCGNGILETHEECDCGSEQISVAGTPCRKSVDPECDFTEYCNGTSSNCVPDTYAMNGQLCRLGNAYCYNGRCQTTDNQCAEICNNLGNCHCIPDYTPPDCELQIGSPGGSIDDGNDHKSYTVFTKKGYNTHQNWLILSFYIFLPFFITCTIMIMKRNEMRKSCNKESVEYEGHSAIVPERYDMNN
ncbi:hypothetical protein MJT46_018734 [Ovis ammon polii x Ovis aries]|uniref:Peptidase M12B domain-containing protein n=1 Tax=Ovis aries TaxID=9940 RepID=A0A835ZIQ2_SHEEP|nr:hypothetical protein JEQ12_013263 [Ovis aries]KAI4550569.1 hypothetical protein MJT46_018734 [Ovis ammon polii x Ovis aries]